MAFEEIIDEIASSAAELVNEVENVMNEFDNTVGDTQTEISETDQEVHETESEVTDNANETVGETISEFETERANLHLKIIGKDKYGRNVSDWCGCNNACTHTAL